MLFHDRATIKDMARITRDGYLVADALVAKADNIQDYMPSEINLPPKADGSPYRIFRPATEVFAKDAMASAAHRPITVGHPSQDVTAENWRTLGVGDIGDQIARDGDFVRVPIKLMDAGAVTKAQTTHPEFSLGYSAELDMTPGKFGDAAYDGTMKNIRVNHLALVPSARGGSSLRIIDERPTQLRDHQEPTMKKIMLDGLQVDLSDAAAVEVAIGKLQTSLTDANTALKAATDKVTEQGNTIVARDAEIVTLKKQVEDAKVTPQQMRDAAKAYAATAAKAKAMGVTVTDSMDEPAIMKAVVDKAMADAAKDYTPEQVSTAFAVLTKDTKVGDEKPAGNPGITGAPINLGDAQGQYEAGRDKRKAAMSDAWRQPFTNSADAA